MTDEQFLKYKQYYADVFSLAENESTMAKLARTLPQLHQMTIDIYTTENNELKMLEIKKDKVYADGYKYYKEESNRDYSNKDIDILMDRNESYRVIKEEYAKQETRVEFFKEMLSSIK